MEFGFYYVETANSAFALFSKSSAVAEMGDRLATVDIGRKVESVPIWRGELGPI